MMVVRGTNLLSFEVLILQQNKQDGFVLPNEIKVVTRYFLSFLEFKKRLQVTCFICYFLSM